MSDDALLDALDPDQREVALALTGPVRVLAGAGTGKTRAITHRIAHGVRSGVYAPGSLLAVTFTARAAGEMRTRLRDLGVAGVQARTFHAAALRQLGFFWPQVVGGAPPRLLEQKASLVAEAARRVGLSVDRVSVRDLASEIEWTKVSLVAADDYEVACGRIGRTPPAGFDANAVARLIVAYEEAKSARSVIDFEDVLMLVGAMLADHPDVADAVRRQYRRFVVDEYQDVSPLQQFVLDQWVGGRGELCVVGDPSQTIYSFTGATPHYLLSFPSTHPGARTIDLVRDYRSTPQVVSLANEVIGRAVADVRGNRPGRPGARPAVPAHPPLRLVAQRPDGPPPAFTVYPDDEQEATGIAARAAALIEKGVRPSEIAVLYRTNAQSEQFEQAFAAAGIGYLVRGGERFFARKEVRDAVVLLRGAARSADPDVPLGETVRDVLLSAGWSPEPPAARGAARERWESMQALVALADDLAARTGASMQELVAELDERAANQHAPTVEGVTLASLHAAKGLEWDAVFLAGLSEGLVPISLAETPEAVAEERRLLYVGVTRAREHLALSYASSRHPGGRASRRRTRFLEDVWPSTAPARRRAERATRTPEVADLSAEEEAVFERLRDWRSGIARETGKPAFTVLVDATLVAIARARPASVDELAGIKGLGPAKTERYGPAILELTAAPG